MDNVEHETQRLLLERLNLTWTPGEPFYSIVQAEIERLRGQVAQLEAIAERLTWAADRHQQDAFELRARLAGEQGTE